MDVEFSGLDQRPANLVLTEQAREGLTPSRLVADGLGGVGVRYLGQSPGLIHAAPRSTARWPRLLGIVAGWGLLVGLAYLVDGTRRQAERLLAAAVHHWQLTVPTLVVLAILGVVAAVRRLPRPRVPGSSAPLRSVWGGTSPTQFVEGVVRVGTASRRLSEDVPDLEPYLAGWVKDDTQHAYYLVRMVLSVSDLPGGHDLTDVRVTMTLDSTPPTEAPQVWSLWPKTEVEETEGKVSAELGTDLKILTAKVGTEQASRTVAYKVEASGEMSSGAEWLLRPNTQIVAEFRFAIVARCATGSRTKCTVSVEVAGRRGDASVRYRALLPADAAGIMLQG